MTLRGNAVDSIFKLYFTGCIVIVFWSNTPISVNHFSPFHPSLPVSICPVNRVCETAFLKNAVRAECWVLEYLWTTHNGEVKYWIRWGCFKNVLFHLNSSKTCLTRLPATKRLIFNISWYYTRYYIWCQNPLYLLRTVKISEPHLIKHLTKIHIVFLAVERCHR